MADTVIENPIINSPFAEPERHFRFEDTGITSEIVSSRRVSSYFMPIAKTKKRTSQLAFDTEWTKDRIEENTEINRIRERVDQWRKMKWQGVTPVTRRLLEYWTNPEREKRLFFCQIEALETVIYITECAKKYGDAWIENFLREANDGSNPGLNRLAFKMATGSGKTVVMALLIAWQALNKLENAQDAKFTDTFLLIAPGITIRDRLRVLLPSDPNNYYRERDTPRDSSLESYPGSGDMSVTKKDQVFPIKPRAISDAEIAEIVADALRKDFGDSPSAVKHIGRVTNANLRAIKNWYGARNAPSSGHLLLLAKSSSSILEFLLKQVGGEQLLDAFLLFRSKQTSGSIPPKIDRVDKIYSTENCTINLSLPLRIARRLNVRQLWFLSQLHLYERVKADNIMAQWGISVVSAKTDIAEMMRLKLIRFVGARKTGYYALVK